MALQGEEKTKVLELVNGLIGGLQNVATAVEADEEVDTAQLADLKDGVAALYNALGGEERNEDEEDKEDEETRDDDEELEEILEEIEEELGE